MNRDDADGIDLSDLVLDVREWPGSEEIARDLGILLPPYMGERLNGSTVTFSEYALLENVTYNRRPLYLVTDWGRVE